MDDGREERDDVGLGELDHDDLTAPEIPNERPAVFTCPKCHATLWHVDAGEGAAREELLRREREARAAAELASRSKSFFLAVMSHELRTPLQAIGGYAELLQVGVHGELTDRQRDAIDRILRSQEYLVSLLNGVLDVTRLERGEVIGDLTAVNVDTLIADAMTIVEPRLRAKRIRYECRPGDPDLAVVAHPERARQILVNLLTNAAKFTPDEGVVRVDWSVREGTAYICVSDTGPGISGDQHEAIFEPFVQGRFSPNLATGGVGLGLAISRQLARALGGDLTLRSEPGCGATFMLSLPRAEGVPLPR